MLLVGNYQIESGIDGMILIVAMAMATIGVALREND